MAARSASGARSSSTRWFEAAERPARADLRPLRPFGPFSRDQPEAPQGNRDRGWPRPRSKRGCDVQLLAHRSDRGRTVGGGPSAHLAGPRRVSSEREAPGPGGRTSPFRPATGARLRRSREDPAGILYFWKGERPRHPNAPQLEGTADLNGGDRRPRHRVLDDTLGSRPRPECPNRRHLPPGRPVRSPGSWIDGSEEERAELIAQRLREWKSAANTLLSTTA